MHVVHHGAGLDLPRSNCIKMQQLYDIYLIKTLLSGT